MEQNGQKPSMGPIVVTGAIGRRRLDRDRPPVEARLRSRRGERQARGRCAPESARRSRILRRQEIDLGKRPLETALWGGAIDNVGGELLTWLTRTVDNWGNIVSIGLAASHKLETTVMPFILRGVSLLGINSSAMPREVRLILGADRRRLQARHLDRIVTQTVPFAELPGAFAPYLEGAVTGRAVVKIR